jgi:hypothetical protein
VSKELAQAVRDLSQYGRLSPHSENAIADVLEDQDADGNRVVPHPELERENAQDGDTAAENDYENDSVVTLQDELRARKLSPTGSKPELVARLREDDAKENQS